MDEKNRKKEKQGSDSQEDAYEFIKETIKQRPPERRQLLKVGGILVGAGAVFGLTAALVFSLVQPKISRILESDYLDKDKWNKMAIRNVSRIGYFSSDRAVMDYANNIWHIKPVD